jgi:hypothetical protein
VGFPLRGALDATQDQLDLALRLATLAGIYGVAWSIVAALHHAWPVLGWTLPALPIAWLFWHSAHEAATSYAGLLRGGFDLHRFDVHEGLRWPKPLSPESEKAHGAELMLYLIDGTGAKSMIYEHEKKKKEAV